MTTVKLVTKCEKAADLIKVGSKIVGKAGNLTLAGETVVNSVKTIATNYSKNKKLFTKENLLCAANVALGVVAGVVAAKGIKSDVKAFKKIAGAEKAAESVTKTSQRVAADAESQLEKTAERTETTNPCTCKGNSQCFVAGTIIKTKDGEKNIEDVEVGDYVLARNPETGEQEYKKVSETFAHKEDVIIHVQIGNEDIQTTFNHPFYVVGKGFVRAGKLEAGDEILTSEGQKISIEKIEIEVLAEPVYVYNFTVEDFHTYFVSELGVWVHNTCLVSKGGSGNNDAVKRMNVGDSGHHVPGVRKTKGRTFEVARSDKTRPTIFSTGTDPGYDHWRLHNAERQYVGPRQGDFIGSNDELFDAYRKAYKGLDDIKVDVKSPDGKTVLGKNVTPSKAVDLIQQWLKDNDLY